MGHPHKTTAEGGGAGSQEGISAAGTHPAPSQGADTVSFSSRPHGLGGTLGQVGPVAHAATYGQGFGWRRRPALQAAPRAQHAGLAPTDAPGASSPWTAGTCTHQEGPFPTVNISREQAGQAHGAW